MDEQFNGFMKPNHYYNLLMEAFDKTLGEEYASK
jgi:hypothetical protein